MTTMTSDTLWKELEAEAKTVAGTGILKRMIAPDAACTMFLGLQRPTLSRLFMLQLPRNILPPRDQIPESRGFELLVHITGEEPDTHATIVLGVTDPMYNEVFSSMTTNLHNCLKDCKDEKLTMNTFLDRLVQWQQFFEDNRINGLSPEGQRGLYGELYFIKHHLLSQPDQFFAEISGWTGSKNRQHDFQFGETVIEVKTSTAKQHQKLEISSEQQLDETLVGQLYLFHLSLSLIENHDDTLPALIEELRGSLQSSFAASAAFDRALQERDYLDTQAWRYQKTGYVVRESNAFRVMDEFPRLTERDLPPGVGDLAYSISVAECRKFAVPIDEVLSHINKG